MRLSRPVHGSPPTSPTNEVIARNPFSPGIILVTRVPLGLLRKSRFIHPRNHPERILLVHLERDPIGPNDRKVVKAIRAIDQPAGDLHKAGLKFMNSIVGCLQEMHRSLHLIRTSTSRTVQWSNLHELLTPLVASDTDNHYNDCVTR
jgi:hypothetical protein